MSFFNRFFLSQGSAFGALSKNVAAPAVAPTPCLKVRHLFDDARARREEEGPGKETARTFPSKSQPSDEIRMFQAGFGV